MRHMTEFLVSTDKIKTQKTKNDIVIFAFTSRNVTRLFFLILKVKKVKNK